jgi:hypothetical protein
VMLGGNFHYAGGSFGGLDVQILRVQGVESEQVVGLEKGPLRRAKEHCVGSSCRTEKTTRDGTGHFKSTIPEILVPLR